MNDEGYTLVDTLSALAILGLAMGSVLTGGALLTRTQMKTDAQVARAMSLKRASVALDGLLARAGPFRSRDNAFIGTASSFEFACGQTTCAAKLEPAESATVLRITRSSGEQESITLQHTEDARFTYTGGRAATASWPPQAVAPQRLRQLAIVAGTSSEPLATTTLSIDQSFRCEFDAVSQDCR